jgi:hypothetical protein
MSKAKQSWNINGHTFKVGDAVTAEVIWKDGRRTQGTGTLVNVVGDDAYINTPIGAVAACADTLEPA